MTRVKNLGCSRILLNRDLIFEISRRLGLPVIKIFNFV